MRLIDADKLLNRLGQYPFMTTTMIRWFRYIINNTETESKKEGRWIPSKNEGFECSECWGMSKQPTLYCPTCGSRNRSEVS